MVISGKKTDAKWFAFDGCHKFYLLETQGDYDNCVKEWGKEYIYPIDDLPKEFYNSCPLRFIQTWGTYKRFVPQCRKTVTFKGFGKFGSSATINFTQDKIYTDEPLPDARNVVFKRFD